MIQFYVLCRYLAENVEKKQDITQIVQKIVAAVKARKLDISEEEQND
jgi:hypothetical protein